MPGWLKRFYQKHVTYLTVTPLLVTVAIIGASIIIGGLIQRNVQSLKFQAIEKQLKENQLLIESKFDAYAQVVWSSAGRLNSAPIDRTSWGLFIGTMQLPKRFPSISSMGVTRIIEPGEREDFLSTLSDQYGQPLQVTGQSSNDMNISMYAYPEKPTTVNNMGFNLYSDEVRKDSLQKATDTNDIAMTEQLQLIANAREGTTSDDSAFLMYAPYYRSGAPLDTVQQRRESVHGHVSASFRTQTVFEQVFKNLDLSHVAIKIYMGEEGKHRLAYASGSIKPKSELLQRSQTIEVFGQQFTVRYDFDSDYLVTAAQLRSPLFMMILGCLIGILVGTITFFFLRGRHHQLLLDKERDVARAKDELLSLASHQLRTPATGVKQYLGMVLQGFSGTLKPKQKELLEKAYKSNERQLHTINDILHLAKLDLGRIVLSKTTFELSDLVRDVIDEQDQDVQAAALKLSAKLPKKSTVHADQHMLRMVIENLVSNAIKYTDPGGRIWVRLDKVEDGFVLSVKDTGVGIADIDRSQLFKQFSRILNPRSHLVSGTGVGLYLAKNLIKLHGGDIGVESTPGKGSIFTLHIPDLQKNL